MSANLIYEKRFDYRDSLEDMISSDAAYRLDTAKSIRFDEALSMYYIFSSGVEDGLSDKGIFTEHMYAPIDFAEAYTKYRYF